MNWKAVRCVVYSSGVVSVLAVYLTKLRWPSFYSSELHEFLWHLVLGTGAAFYVWDHYGCRWWSRRKRKEV